MKAKLSTLWLAVWIPLSLCFSRASIPYELEHALEMSRDGFGRPLIVLTLKASALSILFSASAVFLSSLVAFVIASFSLFLPKKLQFLFDRSLEVLLSIPSLLLGLTWAARFGPSWSTLAVALTLGTLPTLIRFTRARLKDLQNEGYLLASLALGAPPLALIRRHYLPAVVGLYAVKIPSLFAQALLAESSLSFFGLGAPIGQDSWGSLLAQGKDYLLEAPHIAVITGTPLVLTVLALQLLTEHYQKNSV